MNGTCLKTEVLRSGCGGPHSHSHTKRTLQIIVILGISKWIKAKYKVGISICIRFKSYFLRKKTLLWYVKPGLPNYPSDYQLDFPPHKMYLLSQFLSELVQISHSDSVIVYLSKSSRIFNIFIFFQSYDVLH